MENMYHSVPFSSISLRNSINRYTIVGVSHVQSGLQIIMSENGVMSTRK